MNFFKPVTGHARANARLVLATVIIWAVAVFGFQFLLVVFNQDTPEPELATFEAAWAEVEVGGVLTVAQQQDLARAYLSVLGKNIALSDEHRADLRAALSATVHSLLPADQRGLLEGATVGGANADLSVAAATAIGLESSGFDVLRANLLPSSLIPVTGGMGAEVQGRIPEIMSLYLTHNRSGLTDFRFLGFPFHYWYTAQFLLIMFVAMCWIYCMRIDRIHRQHDFIED